MVSKPAELITIKGFSKAAILAALYNAARPVGLGMFAYKAEHMSEEDAARVLEEHGPSFDYVHGRVLKVDLGGDTLDVRLYNRDNGAGAAERALEPVLRCLHPEGDRVGFMPNGELSHERCSACGGVRYVKAPGEFWPWQWA